MTKRPGAGATRAVADHSIFRSLAFAALAGASIGAASMPAPVFAQQQYSFNAVSIEGNQRIEPATILSYAGIARGETVRAGELNAAYQRILGSGLFEDVEVIPQGNTLVIRVTEFPTINRISFEGNRRINDEDLQPLIQSQSRRVYSVATAQADAQVISQAYAEAGRFAARVTPRLIRRSDNRVDLIFEIREGAVSEVERINIVGNSAYSDSRIRRALETKQAGLLRAVIRSDTFIQDRLAFDQQVLTDFYQSRGYVDFQVTSVNAEIAEERDGYFVTFNVQEGQQFEFGEITVNSDIPDADPDEFADILRVRPGVVYSPAIVENSIARLETLANRQGLNFVRVEPRITRNDRDLTLDVEFNLVRGPRIFIERIDIEGNTTTLDRVVRRQFRVAEGDPFNPREIRESAERIRALGFFSNSDVNAREGSSPDSVIIDVDVEEQPTGSIGFGGSFSSDTGFGANISFSERNFLGRGQALGFALRTTEGNRRYSFNFAEPAFLGRDLRYGLGLSYQETDNENDVSFDTTTANFTNSIAFPVSEYGRLSLRYSVSLAEMSNPGNDVGAIVEAETERGELITSGLGYTYTYSTLNRGLDPNAGIQFTFSQDFNGVGGDVQSVRTTARLAGERKIRNEEITLRAALEGGALVTQGDGSRTLDRFRLSSRDLRGFEPGGVGPREIGDNIDDPLGGNYFATAKVEAQFPLGLPEEYGITGGLFFDVGNLWSLDTTDTGDRGTEVLYEDGAWRSVVGASIFWDTAIGPLRFNFTEAISAEKEDNPRNFEFTISTRF